VESLYKDNAIITSNCRYIFCWL